MARDRRRPLMNKQKLVYAGVIAAVVAAAVIVWAVWRPSNNANFPQGTLWLCSNPKCSAEFRLTMQQLGEHYKAHYGERPKCPKCGSEAYRADKCPSCGKVFPQTRGGSICPYCGKPLPSPEE